MLSEGPPSTKSVIFDIGEVASGDYQRFLAHLDRFSKENIDDVNNLDDLSEKTLGVGHYLRMVILALGSMKVEKKLIASKEVEETFYRLGIDQPGILMTADTLGDRVNLGKYTEMICNYRLGIPTRADFNHFRNHSMINYFHALVPKNLSGYFPFANPNCRQDQQGYVRTLQQAVSDVITMAPSSVPIPDYLENAYPIDRVFNF